MTKTPQTPQTPKTRFETREFQWAHGRTPRGHGSWAFQALDGFGRKTGQVVFVDDSSFGDAKRQAVARLTAANGRKPEDVEVLP